MDDGAIKLTRDWLAKAARDLQNARIVGREPGGPLDTAVYHCQQAAEKAVKGWLVWQGIEFEKTHDVARLVRKASAIEPAFNSMAEAAQLLNPYVSAFRYPGLTDESMPSLEELNTAIQHAQTIFDFVLNLVPAEARP